MATTTVYNSHTQDASKPSYQIASYQRQMQELAIVRTFCAGIDRVREGGKTYLTAFPREEPDAYDYRLRQSLIFNDTERTVKALVGRVFRKPPELGEDMPVEITGVKASDGISAQEGWAENVDLEGNHWHIVARQAFEDAVRDGHSFIFVDMPPPIMREDGAPATLEDEKRAGLRPYWTRRTKDQAINWSYTTENGKRILKHITFREETSEPDGAFGEKAVVRYRVLMPGEWQLWREEKDSKTGKTDVIFETGGTSSLPVIPVGVVYAGQTGYLESTPPLKALAQIECSRMNLYSDYRTGIHMTIPVIVRKGADANTPIQSVGWHTIFDVPEGGDVKYAESNGHGLAYYEKELAALDQRMAIFGLSLLSKPEVQMTASQAVLTDKKEQAPIETAAQSLHDALELAFGWMCDYAKLPHGSVGAFDLGKEFMLTPQLLQVLFTAAANGQLSKEFVLSVLKEHGISPEDFDVDEELERLEMAEQMVAERQRRLLDSGLDPAGGATGNVDDGEDSNSEDDSVDDNADDNSGGAQ